MDGHSSGAFLFFGDLPRIRPYLVPLYDRGLTPFVLHAPAGSPMQARALATIDAGDVSLGDQTVRREVDPDDLDAVVNQVGMWRDRFDIVGMLNVSEYFVEAAGVVADLFGFPGVSLRASRACRDKLLQRHYLRDWSPAFQLVRGGEGIPSTMPPFPLVAKPLHLYGSRGVQSFTDPERVADRIASLPEGEHLLLEERISGREYNVDSIVVGCRPVFTLMTQKRSTEHSSDYFAELVHTLPPVNLSSEEEQRITDAQADVLRRLDFGTGYAHAEYRVTDDGRVVLMEIAARPPGDGCMNLYELTTGHPMEAELVAAALGDQVTSPQVRRRARQIYFEHLPGRLDDVTVTWPEVTSPTWIADSGLWPSLKGCEVHDAATLRTVLVLAQRGAELRPIEANRDRAVTAIFDCPIDTDVDTVEAMVRAAVDIRLERPAIAGHAVGPRRQVLPADHLDVGADGAKTGGQ